MQCEGIARNIGAPPELDPSAVAAQSREEEEALRAHRGLWLWYFLPRPAPEEVFEIALSEMCWELLKLMNHFTKTRVSSG